MVGQEPAVIERTRVASVDDLSLLASDPAALPAAVKIAAGDGSRADHPRVQTLPLLAADNVATASMHCVIVARGKQQRLASTELFSQLCCQAVVPVEIEIE